MAIQRAAALPAPASEVSGARSTLARRYGALVWDGPDRRVLLLRVPRAEPDPVNDVEEAVEYLRAEDTHDITHCLLIGDNAVAQVYTRPLQELMQQREALDRRIAQTWRERLPGTLAHTLFQSPEDPRRRWRLAVRLPSESVRDLDEHLLEEVADAIGPELETSRMRQVCAVYLIASQDDVRLEADLFLQQMLDGWRDEDRRRRAELAQAQRRDEERRRKETERRRIVAEMERTLQRRAPVRRQGAPAATGDEGPSPPTRTGVEAARNERPGPAPRHAPLAESSTTITARPEVRHLRQQVDRLPRGPWLPEPAEADADLSPQGGGPTLPAGPDPSRAAASGAGPDAARDAAPRLGREPSAGRTSLAGPTPSAGRTSVDGPAGRSRRLAGGGHLQEGSEQAAAVDKLDELRGRVDRAMRDTRGILPERSVRQRLREERARREAPGASLAPAPAPSEPSARPAEQRVPSPHEARVAGLLEAAGFELLVSPSTAHVIDLAAERVEGDPQRVVVRFVERLDHPAAQSLLKTARELDVDLVLCVADSVDPESRKMIVATKIRVLGPGEIDALRL